MIVGIVATVLTSFGLMPAPVRPPAPVSATVRAAKNVYEAGSRDRRLADWNAPTVSPNTATLARLGIIRDRSRAAVRNNGIAKKAIQVLVTNLVGTGISPLSKAQNVDLRKLVAQRFAQWSKQCSAAGTLNFDGLCTQAVWGWMEAGEEFIRLRSRLPSDGLVVPLQLEVLEPELVPYTYTGQSPNGNWIRAGFEFNGIGQIVASWFHPSRPELDDFNRALLVRIPQSSVIHLYDPLRAGQLRGLPILTQALIKLQDLDKFDNSALIGQQVSNLFSIFVKKPASAAGSNINVLTGLDDGEAETERAPLLPLEPGLVQELDPGDEVTFANPPGVAATYVDFMRQQMRAAAAAVGVPYELLSGDMSGMNDRTIRVVLNEFRRRLMAWQYQIIVHQFCQRVWDAWFDAAVLAGTFGDLVDPADYVAHRDDYTAVEWIPHTWPYIHPVQDVTAKSMSVQNGFETRSSVVSELGDDAAAVDEQQAEDNKRADDLGLKYTSDGRQKAAASAAPLKDTTYAPDPEDTGAVQ